MRELFFPYSSKFGRVLGVLRMLQGRGGRLSLDRITKISKLNLEILMPQIRAAELLGAVKLEVDGLVLTSLGRGLLERDGEAMHRAKEALEEFEPFKSAVELSRTMGHFSINDLELMLNKGGFILHTNPLESRRLLREVLIQWAIAFRLFHYNGVRKEWLEVRA